MNLPFDLHDELKKLRRLELEALKADNAVLRQRCKIFPPLEQEIAKLLTPMEEAKDKIIMDAIQKTGSKSKAADLLGIGRATVYNRMRKVKLNGVAALVLLFAVTVIGQLRTNVVLEFDYPATELSTNLTFKVYSTTNITQPVTNWPVLLTVVGTNASITIPMTAQQRFFVITASNYWGEGNFSAVAQTPPPPRDLVQVRLK